MRLSRDLDEMKPSYDAIVVGSGYGAGVAASRLARMGLSVAVLERGVEIPIGEFPDTAAEAIEQFQYTIDGHHVGRRTGLYDMHVGRDMHVLVGCGLGGTSLINANVSLPPNARVWEDPSWPAELFDDDDLNDGFERAKAMLRPAPYPVGDAKRKPLAKLDRMKEAAARLETELTYPPINVAFEAGTNAAGVNQPACTGCGDCCSGCNVGAKTTVQMTYLPDAVNHGAEIFTDVGVRYVRKEADGWRVFYIVSSKRRDGFRSPERSISAKIVVLGAGSLGSTEVLLRSQQNGLAVSPRLGHGFTGNGDVLAFAYNGHKPVNGVGIGEPARASVDPPGPCIASAIDLRHKGPLQEGMIIEEGVLPSGLAELLPGIFAVGKHTGIDTRSGLLDEFQEGIRGAESWILGSYKGSMHHTATYLVMAHDDAAGRLHLKDDRVAVDWPNVASQAVFKSIEEKLVETSAANSATFIRNPIQNQSIFGKNLITVHPLGGCGIGPDRMKGVVDHKCRVYDASAGAATNAVHEGLYVVDGAALPRSLGVNPLLTITAIAERAMMKLAEDIGRTLDTVKKPDVPVRHLVGDGAAPTLMQGLVRTLKQVVLLSDMSGLKAVEQQKKAAAAGMAIFEAGIEKLKTDAGLAKAAVAEANPQVSAGDKPNPLDSGPRPAGVEFTERMAGYVSDRAGTDHAAAATVGHSFGKTFAFTVTVRIDDIDAFLIDPMHEGRLTGTALCPELSSEPLDISNGVFRLMRKSDDAAKTRLFEYNMTLTARDGASYAFIGTKFVHDDHHVADLWRDTTTLFIDAQQQGGPKQWRGILQIAPDDFARQLSTLKGVGGRSHLERVNAVAKFGALFASTLFDVYGSIFAPAKRFNPNRVRTKRGLRAGTPRVHFFPTQDGKTLRLTRYNKDGANTKGPLLFTHGLGVASSIFSIDTIDTNMLEYMAERGYDCWLLDFRASIDLPYARELWTADDCAMYDYQPAVDLIRRETGAASVQVLAHCFGSTTFVMSVLGGYVSGIRSAVLSQIATDVIVKFYPQRLLAYLRMPSLMSALGIEHVNARATTEDGFANKLIDGLIRVAVPFQREERSRNATSNRITALYGQLYETDQLNAMTFDSGLAEMFGESNIAAFKQLAILTRKQVLLDANGEDRYMPHLDRMAFPVCFIHGAENACFQPESTQRTMDKLVARNGGKFYTRHVIPNYGHIDCIFGKNAASDVYPKIYEHFELTA